jgi:hypothetical protein
MCEKSKLLKYLWRLEINLNRLAQPLIFFRLNSSVFATNLGNFPHISLSTLDTKKVSPDAFKW